VQSQSEVIENLKCRKYSSMEMICSCFKEKDAPNPPGSVENANAVECSEHLDFYHILPFHKQEFQAFSACCIRIGTERGKK